MGHICRRAWQVGFSPADDERCCLPPGGSPPYGERYTYIKWCTAGQRRDAHGRNCTECSEPQVDGMIQNAVPAHDSSDLPAPRDANAKPNESVCTCPLSRLRQPSSDRRCRGGDDAELHDARLWQPLGSTAVIYPSPARRPSRPQGTPAPESRSDARRSRPGSELTKNSRLEAIIVAAGGVLRATKNPCKGPTPTCHAEKSTA